MFLPLRLSFRAESSALLLNVFFKFIDNNIISLLYINITTNWTIRMDENSCSKKQSVVGIFKGQVKFFLCHCFGFKVSLHFIWHFFRVLAQMTKQKYNGIISRSSSYVFMLFNYHQQAYFDQIGIVLICYILCNYIVLLELSNVVVLTIVTINCYYLA